MARVPRGEVELRYTSDEGEDAARIGKGRPVRGFAWFAGMRHYPGWWSSTMGDLVGYESLLERDRLLLADFDPDVVAIASQPFGLTGRDEDADANTCPTICCAAAMARSSWWMSSPPIWWTGRRWLGSWTGRVAGWPSGAGATRRDRVPIPRFWRTAVKGGSGAQAPFWRSTARSRPARCELGAPRGITGVRKDD